MGKKIIAFSLWGKHRVYNYGAIANVEEAKIVYPDWKCRFYVSDKSPILLKLKQLDCEVVPLKIETAWKPLFWRFEAASDKDIDYVIFRDCDSRVNWREEGAVREWITSGKKAHIMKDWPAPHATETILAGMWGLRGGVISNMPQLIKQWCTSASLINKYVDQDFLRTIIWPKIKDSVMNHGVDSPSGKAKPFPKHKPMRHGEYVGQVIQPPPIKKGK
jgi:hypothetical protein